MDEVFRALRAQNFTPPGVWAACAAGDRGHGCPQAPYNPLPLLYVVMR